MFYLLVFFLYLHRSFFVDRFQMPVVGYWLQLMINSIDNKY